MGRSLLRKGSEARMKARARDTVRENGGEMRRDEGRERAIFYCFVCTNFLSSAQFCSFIEETNVDIRIASV